MAGRRKLKEMHALANSVIEERPKDSVIVPIYALHRSHVLWENPDVFDPARLENPKSIKRYAYLTFGDGPRICIGASFALQEAIIILPRYYHVLNLKWLQEKNQN